MLTHQPAPRKTVIIFDLLTAFRAALYSSRWTTRVIEKTECFVLRVSKNRLVLRGSGFPENFQLENALFSRSLFQHKGATTLLLAHWEAPLKDMLVSILLVGFLAAGYAWVRYSRRPRPENGHDRAARRERDWYPTASECSLRATNSEARKI